MMATFLQKATSPDFQNPLAFISGAANWEPLISQELLFL